MSENRSLRQTQIVSILVATILAASIYVLHPVLHYAIAPDPVLTAGAALTLILLAFALRHVASRMFSGHALVFQVPPAGATEHMASANNPLSQQIERELAQLRRLIEILCRQLRNSSETGEKAAIHLAKDLLEIDKALFRNGPDVVALPADTHDRVADRLGDALSRIQFQDTVKQQIASVIQALERLDGYAAQLATGLQRPECVDTHPMKPAATLLDELYDSYISEQQRSIHNASLKHPAASFAHSRTELF